MATERIATGLDDDFRSSVEDLPASTRSAACVSRGPVTKTCRWCLEPFVCVTPRQIARQMFCCQEHGRRHASRRRYASADGYGASLRATRCCRCGSELPSREIVQGRNSRVLCESCQLPSAKECPFCSRVHRGSSPACSQRCSRALRDRHFDQKSRTRRERIAASPESFTREEIFERDGWRCGICGEPTDRAEAHPHPAAPVIDHVVPIAAGGEHVRSNVQCAHSRCNTLKGATIPDGAA